MLATLTRGVFSVPENPVMRGLKGFGLLQAGNGYAMGQDVDIASTPVQTATGPGGSLVWTGGAADGSIYTSSYCDQIITGGSASDTDKFQCSIRGYVGAAPVLAIPPALNPPPPTSVTIPAAAIAISNPPRKPVARVAPRCSQASQDSSSTDLLLILAAFAVGYFVTKGGN